MAESTSFFAEQDKRRAQVWRYSALSFLLLLCAGLPLAMVVTPLVYALLAVVARVLDFLLPIPAEFWEGLRISKSAIAADTRPVAQIAITVGVLIVPGIVVIAWIWWRLRQSLERAGSAWMVATLGGRERRQGDLEETQIANLAEEMAIAAGVTPPPVFIVDEPAPNAALVGPNDGDAAFIVTRGLLDGFDRDATQAVIGYLMAGARQGNLQAATAVITAFHAFGLVLLVFDACINFSRQSWVDLRRVLAWLARPQHFAAESQQILALLERTDPPEDGLTGLQADLTSDQPPRTRFIAVLRKVPVLYVLLLPALLVYIVFMFIRFELFLLRALLIGPVLVLAWRQRVYLADAAAVQFTRNPQSLADAIQAFLGLESVGLGSRWLAAYCFIGAEQAGASRKLTEEPGALTAHPTGINRLRRIGAMGASVDVGPAPRLRLPTWAELRRSSLWGLLLIPLVLLIGYLLLVVIGMVLGLATLFSLFFVLTVLSIISGVMP
ncbi:MAG: hypothetical protein OEQ39_19165 [Gammaproteobacteria bacterium]|nr:hypothetical protein [Gammaproteobacteria bacterium]MDH3465762.1 hypothetical protein [Gammaproteobacteria bacterium]